MDTEEAKRNVLVYLDHNVLDLMRESKGTSFDLRELLKESGYTPIYSPETLEEIYRSKGGEQEFLDVLESIKAKYIATNLDENFKCAGTASIHEVSPNAQYQRFLENKLENLEGDFGFSELSMKIYGGKKEHSFKEILDKNADDLQGYLTDLLNDTEGLPEEAIQEIEKIRPYFSNLSETIKELQAPMVQELDALEKSPLLGFQDETGIGPLRLKNIKGPNILQKVWEEVKQSPKLASVEFDTFFWNKAFSLRNKLR